MKKKKKKKKKIMSSFDRKIGQLKTFIEQKDYENIISFINHYTEAINEPCYEGKTLLQLLIENRIDNEEIYNELYIKKAIFEISDFSDNKNDLFYNNIGLIKSIINHGFYIIDVRKKKQFIKHIDKPLFFFIKKGNNDMVKKLLENGANIEDVDEKTGFTPFFYTIKCSKFDTFRLLLNDYHNNLTTEEKQNLLMYMRGKFLRTRTRNRKLETKKSEVFQCFADMDNIINNCETTELNNENLENGKKEKKDVTYQLITAIDQKDCEKIINILSQSNNIDTKTFFNDLDLTMDMAMKNSINNKELYDFIIKKGAIINSYFFKKRKGKNDFSKYIENNSGLIKSIIENGFYIFVIDDHRNEEKRYISDPLKFFKEKNLDEIVKVLLDNKASLFEIDNDIQVRNKPFINKLNDPSKMDKNIENKLLECIDHKNYKEIINIFYQSGIDDINKLYSDKRTVMDILLDKKIDNKEVFDFIIKHKGFINNYYLNSNRCELIESNIGLIRSIIENGFYIKKFNKEIIHINTPLIFFIEKKLNGMVKVLLRNKAYIEETDENGETPLFQTIKSENYEIFELLLHQYQADITKINKKNQTLLMLAINCSKVKINPFIIELKKQEWENALEMRSEFFTTDNINSMNAIMKNEDPLALAIRKNDYEKIMIIINQFTSATINNLYADGKTIMSIMIEFIVNSKDIYDLLFEKGAYIDRFFLKFENLKLINKNNGLMESMVQNGFYTNIFGYKISFIDTPLIFFTKLGKIDLIQNLLKNGSSPNEVDAYGLTPIFYAIDHQNVRIVKLLHNREADMSKKNHLNETPLEYAKKLSKRSRYKNDRMNEILSFLEEQISNNFERLIYIKRQLISAIHQKDSNEIINILEQSNIDINYKFNKRYSVMDMIIDNRINDKKVFDFLIKKQSSINDLEDRSELIKNNLGLIQSIIKYGCYVSHSKGEVIYINNPLMFFIGKKMNGIVKVLLENKASLEEVDDNGNTPLFQAIKKKNYEIFDLLIHQYPIDITKRNKNDKTPLMYAIFHGEKKFDPFAIELKRIEKIGKDTTIDTGTDGLMIKNDPLEIAIYQNNDKKIMSIINQYTTDDINEPNIFGKPIMSILIENNVGSKAIYDLLFDKKASIDENLFKSNDSYLISRNNGLIESIASNGFYVTNDQNIITCITEPVIFFTKIGNKAIVKKLLDKKCSPNEMDSFGFTPIFYAISYQKIEVFDLLLEYEADLAIKTNRLNLTPLTYAIGISRSKIFEKRRIQPYDKMLRYMNNYLKIDNLDNFPLGDALKLLKINYILFKLKNKGKGKRKENEERYHHPDNDNSNQLESKEDSYNDDDSSNANDIEKIDDQGNMLLLKLVKNSNSDIRMIENLLSSGANVNYCDDDNKTPLIYAVENEDIELVKLLIKYKADINYEVCGRTPLKLAIKKNNIDIARIILEEKERKKNN